MRGCAFVGGGASQANAANVYHLGEGSHEARAMDAGSGVASPVGDEDLAEIPVQKLNLDIGSILVGPAKITKKLTKKEIKRLKRKGAFVGA